MELAELEDRVAQVRCDIEPGADVVILAHESGAVAVSRLGAFKGLCRHWPEWLESWLLIAEPCPYGYTWAVFVDGGLPFVVALPPANHVTHAVARANSGRCVGES